MITYTDGRAAATALKGYVVAALKQAPHAATFARWRGVAVLTQDDEKPAPREPRPQVIISLDRDEQSRLVRIVDARDATLNLEVRTNEFSGATSGRGEMGSDTLLSRALAQLLDDKQAGVLAAIQGLGFYSVEWRSERENTKAVQGATQQHSDPSRIVVTYFVPR